MVRNTFACYGWVYSRGRTKVISLKVSHPHCVVKIQIREEYPICVQSQNTTKHKTKFITLLQHYNNMFRPKLLAFIRLYMKPIVCMP